MAHRKHIIKETVAFTRNLLISLVGWILVFLAVVIFSIYRQIIDVILRIKYGKLYGGLFHRTDMLVSVKDTSKCCITTVLYVKSEKKVNLLDTMRKVFQEKVFDYPELYPKLTCGRQDFAGYPYWIKNGCKLDDVVHPLEVPDTAPLTEEYLKEVTAKITNGEHPKNGTVLWDIHVSVQPVQGSDNDNSYRYPIVTRFHHAIGDGTSLVALFMRLFGDEKSENYGEELFKKLLEEKPTQNGRKSSTEVFKLFLTECIKTICLYMEFLLLSLGRVTARNHLRPMDINALHGPNFSGEKVAAWIMEERVECIPLIKDLKNRANTKFVCVVCTAVAISLTNYFKRNSLPIPDYTSGGISHLLDFPPDDNSKPVRLENKTVASLFAVPSTNKSRTLVDILEEVTENMTDQMRQADNLVTRFILRYGIGWIPLNILRPCIGFNACTFFVTNVPGGSQIQVLDGCILEKIVPIAPNFRGAGVSIALLSYDNRLQIGVLVDKTLTESQKEIQKFTDDILYNIKMLDIEYKKLCEKKD